jgi:WD40 repeat protein
MNVQHAKRFLIGSAALMQVVCSKYYCGLEIINLCALAPAAAGGPTKLTLPVSARTCSFLPGGQHLVVGSESGSLLLWDHVRCLELHRVRVHGCNSITNITYHEEEELLAAGDDEGYVSVWDLSGGKFKMVQLCR